MTTEKGVTRSSRQKLKRRLRGCLNLGLANMLDAIGSKECFGHGPMRLLDATCEIGLPDGTSVKVRARTKTLATLTSNMPSPISHSLSPTKNAKRAKTTDHLSREELDDLLWR